MESHKFFFGLCCLILLSVDCQALEKPSNCKWVGKATAEISGVKADQIWPFVADFCNIYKWAPLIDSSHCLEDGLFRLATSSAFPTVDGSATGQLKEKLVELDPKRRSMSYQIMDNNVGFPVGGYVGTGQVKVSASGCTLVWSFATTPIPGFKLEDLRSSLHSTVTSMAQRMEAAAKASGA